MFIPAPTEVIRCTLPGSTRCASSFSLRSRSSIVGTVATEELPSQEMVIGIIVCGDTLAKKKPDPLPLLHAAAYFGVAPADALMLGDSKSDVAAARAAGFQIVCMSYGYNHGEDIRDYAPDAVIDSMVELAGLL